MKKKETKNISESVRKRLYNIAQETNRTFDAVSLQYFQERFLYRISISDYKEKLILKGALLLLIRDITRFRPTKDIDFLGSSIANDPENINKIISVIASINIDDGVVFNPI